MKPFPFTQLVIAAGASLVLASPVLAQTEAEDDANVAAEIEEIIVTGSRLRRDSFNVSTPLAIMGTEGVELEFAFEPFRNTLALLTYAYTDSELTRFTELGIIGFDPGTFEPIFGVLDRRLAKRSSTDSSSAMSPAAVSPSGTSPSYSGGRIRYLPPLPLSGPSAPISVT